MVKKIDITNKKLISEETLLTVRTCGSCILAAVQEFARIIFVDNILSHPKNIEDHKPLLTKPAYETLTHLLFGSKLVRL